MGRNGKKSNVWGTLLKFVLPLAVSVGLCWLLFHEDNFSDIWEAVESNCNFWWIGGMLVLSFMSNVFRALRWQIQLAGADVPTPFKTCLYGIFGTYATNLVFPRLGEVWRCGYVANRCRAPFATVFGTMIADRFADLLTGALFVVATLFFGRHAIVMFFRKYPDTIEKIQSLVASPWLWIILGGIVSAIVLVCMVKTKGGVLARIHGFISDLWEGFASIVSMPGKWKWLLWTVGLWGCYFFQMYLAFMAFPFSREIFAQYGWSAVLITFTLGSVAMGVPSNGGFGPYQLAIIFALGMFLPHDACWEVKKAFEIDSKAFANLVLAAGTLLVIVLGLWTFISIAIDNRRHRRSE